jgi:hypothetical protein
VLDTTKKNAGIHSITIKLKSPADESLVEQTKNELAEYYEIDVGKIKVNIW